MSSTLETPSGKGIQDENFPVGSWLLSSHVRPHIAVYYAFARAVDDIADNPDLSSQEKIHRLEAFDNALLLGQGNPHEVSKALQLRKTCLEKHIPLQYGLDLIVAFKQDAIKTRYTHWNDLLNYCMYSAVPVGRFLLELHQESFQNYPAADALCSALQVLNHMQDCQRDYCLLDRIYLPQQWMHTCGADTQDLLKTSMTPNLSRVIHLCLDEVEHLLRFAKTLPYSIRNLRFRMECAVVVSLAWRLLFRLRHQDTLAQRVALSKKDFFIGGFHGILQALWS